MYCAEDLAAYPLLRDVIQDSSLRFVLDSLTGVVSRPYILRYVQRLIDARVPHELAIIDLDNFKDINDRYGHSAGDIVLSRLGEDLRRCAGADGLVGRFGGDEFLLVTFQGNDYDRVHDFYEALYAGRVFRREIQAGEYAVTMTATTGCAAFPKDADDYDSLFSRVDKALYRGKSKGRNCYIIYLREKHERLQITSLARRSMYETFRQMAEGFSAGRDLREKLKAVYEPLRVSLRLSRLIYADAGGRAVDALTGESLGALPGLDGLTAGGVCVLNNLDPLLADYRPLFDFLTSISIGSALILRVGEAGSGLGQLIFCPEVHNMHIWQDDECAAAFILACMTGQYLNALNRADDR